MHMVVLVDSGTASAAEIVAGALSLNGRAVLLGESTRGKQYVQSMFPLPNNMGQLNLTTAYYVPGVVDIDEDKPMQDLVDLPPSPIVPHVRVSIDSQRRKQQIDRLRLVAALGPVTDAARRLENADEEPAEEDVEEALLELIRLDPQLSRAVELVNSPQEIEAILIEHSPGNNRRGWTEGDE
jgi:carboxyl-terminal processing protease